MCRRRAAAGKANSIWWTATKRKKLKWSEEKGRKKSIFEILNLKFLSLEICNASAFIYFTLVFEHRIVFFNNYSRKQTRSHLTFYFVCPIMNQNKEILFFRVHFCFHCFSLTYTSNWCCRWITYDLLPFWERDLI
jgi:hypothetical protein